MFGFKSRKFKNLESKISSLEKELNDQLIIIEKLKSDNTALRISNQSMSKTFQSALLEKTKYEERQKQLIPSYNAAMKRIDDALKDMHLTPELVNAFHHNYNQELYLQSIKEAVLQHSFDKPPIVEKIDIYAKIHSTSSKEIYRTTLTECSCSDHRFRDRPCKHMLYLAFILGLLQINQKEYRFTNQIISENYATIRHQKEEISCKKEYIRGQEIKQEKLEHKNQQLKKRNENLSNEIEKIINDSIFEATRISAKVQSEIDEIRFNKNRKSKK